MDMAFIQKYFDWLGHIIEAAVIALVLAVPLAFATPISFATAYLITGFGACMHFHGREKRDYEVSVKMRPPHLKGYLMWKWNLDQQTDFWPVVLVWVLYAGGWFYWSEVSSWLSNLGL